eukprot:scaffold102991_cov36-Attheya_sp.AAC.1
MNLEFDAIKMATQGVKCVGGECVICEEEREVEAALAVAVACREQAGDPVSGTEACQMALRFSLDLENRQRARQGQWAMVGPDIRM